MTLTCPPSPTRQVDPSARLPPSLLLGLLLLGSAGCDEWPRSAHLGDKPDPDAVEGSGDAGDAVAGTISWAGPVAHAEVGDQPGVAVPHELSRGSGLVIAGALVGSGWDPSAETTTWSNADCNSDAWFPPTDQGNYTGDVDWLHLDLTTEAWLCARVVLSDVPDDTVLNYDFMLYEVDSCGVPTAPVADGDSDLPLGFGAGDVTWGWGTRASAGRHALVLAPYYPDDDALVLPWRVAVSLPSSGTSCPAMPGEDQL